MPDLAEPTPDPSAGGVAVAQVGVGLFFVSPTFTSPSGNPLRWEKYLPERPAVP